MRHLEYYRGDTIGWVEIEAELTEPLGGGSGSNTGLGTRGIAGLVFTTVVTPLIIITISTFGNSKILVIYQRKWNPWKAMGSMKPWRYCQVDIIQVEISIEFVTVAS